MTADEQSCPLEGVNHAAHCVESQGHWHCPGMRGTRDATVGVPVRLLRKLVEDEPGAFALGEARGLLPRRRMVAVEDDGTNIIGEYLATLPDLLTLLDGVIEEVGWRMYGIETAAVTVMKSRIRTALGVDQ